MKVSKWQRLNGSSVGSSRRMSSEFAFIQRIGKIKIHFSGMCGDGWTPVYGTGLSQWREMAVGIKWKEPMVWGGWDSLISNMQLVNGLSACLSTFA